MKYFSPIVKLAVVLVFAALLIYNIAVKSGRRAAEKFEVRGVDVSSYQGEIDWAVLRDAGISFAFIKATEGSGYVDRYFAENIEGARTAGLRAGAYHFFSYDSSGISQAENFIKTVPKYDDMLPPVVDLEFYGEYEKKPPAAEKVCKILDELLKALREYYGKRPIIYATRRSYSLYISGRYKDCDIWICDIVKKPNLPDGRQWAFWQYSHTEKLPGYNGTEEFIDMNVFYGTHDDFLRYGFAVQ